MRITKIKLAGFKSFVDPTTLHLPGNLTGVVGPNGCGKSNIIDAMMWVMGESSAKHLRGDSMADVIFSGSSSRKPVGQASVELIFDNTDGTLGGAYAGFAEISIKRTISRDGVSNYYLNGARCRRKDIIDVFLGTGLGARGGYSVIEQGMISRVIEAKPEELRGFLEEAAGISKYRERRRETETRIKHTLENLARVNDVREELDKQLQHLQRQAKAAEKYQELKQEERRLEAEVLGIRWRGLAGAMETQQKTIGERETALEGAVAEVRRVEARQVDLRAQQAQTLEGFNAQQSAFYAKAAEVSRLEQTLQHNEDRRKALATELERARLNLEDTRRVQREDNDKQATVTAEIAILEPDDGRHAVAEEEAAEDLRRREQAAEEWQQEWDNYHRQRAEAARLEHAEHVRLELLQAGFAQAQQRAEVLRTEQSQLLLVASSVELEQANAELAAHEQAYDRAIAAQQELRISLQDLRAQASRHTEELHQSRSELQQAVGQESSLSALQRAALGRDNDRAEQWLAARDLQHTPILASALNIEPGWELALEVALPIPLATLCEEGLVAKLAAGSRGIIPDERLGALEQLSGPPAAPPRPGMPPRLLDKVECGWRLDGLLANVYVCDGLDAGLALRSQLRADESLIAQDGTWLGPNWIQWPGRDTAEAGVLARQRALEDVQRRVVSLQGDVAAKQTALDTLHDEVQAAEHGEQTHQQSLQDIVRAIAEYKSRVAVKNAERERSQARLQTLTRELQQLAEQALHSESTLTGLRETVGGLKEQLEQLARQETALNHARRDVQAALETARNAWRGARDARHVVALKLQGLRATLESLTLACTRNGRLEQELAARCADLEAAANAVLEPQQTLQAQLNAALNDRIALEDALKLARTQLESCEESLREADSALAAATREQSDRQLSLEQARLEVRALEVRSQELSERLAQQGWPEPAALIAELAADATEEAWRIRLETIANRINRLGPINLAAIDEFAQLSERKTYLDNQCADLSQALATLEDAIQKIDRETRTRFRETFDKVNAGMQAMFPVLFGGGHAYLELTGDDLLETGVAVMARPPGKRNSTIHLLSGGEKALTALAFVFSLFELNPAPFCLLDEVDAPLDDANVVRLTDMLKTMSERVQFLFVTHNKITMEIAQQLIGVTMHEAGVSRLVTVNMEEAVALAATAA